MVDELKIGLSMLALLTATPGVEGCSKTGHQPSVAPQHARFPAPYNGSLHYAERIESELIRQGCVKNPSRWARYFEITSAPKPSSVHFLFTEGEMADDSPGRYNGPLPVKPDDRPGQIAFGVLEVSTDKVSIEACGNNLLTLGSDTNKSEQ